MKGRKKSYVNSGLPSDRLRVNNGSTMTSQTAPTAGRGHVDDQIYQNVTVQSERGNGNAESNIDDVNSTASKVGCGSDERGYDVYIGEEIAEPVYDEPCTVIVPEAGRNTDASTHDSPRCDSTERTEMASPALLLRKPSLKPKPKSLKDIKAVVDAAAYLKQGNSKQNGDAVTLVENEVYVTENGTNSQTWELNK